MADSGPVMILAGIAAAGSFTHIRDTANDHGQHGPMAWAIAVSIDLTCVMAARERQRDKRTGRRRARVSWPTVVLIGGILLSLAANLAQAEASPWGWVIGATPAVGFLVAVSMLERRASVARHDQTPDETVTETVTRHVPPVQETPDETVTETVTRHDAPRDETPDRTPDRTMARQKRTRRGPSRTDKTRVEAAAILITQPDISGAELGRQVGVSARTGARLKHDLSGQSTKELSHSL